MRRASAGLGLLLAFLVSAAAAEPGSGAEAASPPFAAMRRLQMLQEQIAHGNGAAQAAQPKLMAHIAERFLAAGPEVWHEPRNARAAVLFLLSGGKPAVVRAVLAKASFPHEYDGLIKGALAYGEGDDSTARSLLGGIDPRSLPTMLGGHLALVQATLLSDQDGAKAAKLLDLARLLVPGTLVEEAALRRQIYLLAGPETFDKFVFLSREYVRRFRNSVYADNFKQRLGAVATRLASAGDVAALNKFDAILSELPPSEQLASYLTTARAALVQGKAAAARSEAEKAAVLAAEQSPDGIRSKLYADAALIVSDDSGAGLKSLASIERSRLSPADAELRDAAVAVATGVRSEASETDRGLTGPANVVPSDGPALATIEEARSALADTDKLLQDAGRLAGCSSLPRRCYQLRPSWAEPARRPCRGQATTRPSEMSWIASPSGAQLRQAVRKETRASPRKIPSSGRAAVPSSKTHATRAAGRGRSSPNRSPRPIPSPMRPRRTRCFGPRRSVWPHWPKPPRRASRNRSPNPGPQRPRFPSGVRGAKPRSSSKALEAEPPSAARRLRHPQSRRSRPRSRHPRIPVPPRALQVLRRDLKASKIQPRHPKLPKSPPRHPQRRPSQSKSACPAIPRRTSRGLPPVRFNNLR